MGMSSIIGALRVVFGADTAAFEHGSRRATREMRRTERQFKRTGQKIARIGKSMSLAMTAPILAIGASTLKAGIDHNKAMAQVTAGVDSMNGASGKSAEELKKIAFGLESLSEYNADEVLTKVTANMLTFGNVADEQFERAQQAALDMSARLGQDLKSSAILVGKALNDPVKGLSALSRVGVQFSDDQKKIIKGMADVGDVAGAQTFILRELERQYAGSAKAARDAAPGSDVTDIWRKFQRTVGEIVVKVLPPLEKMLSKVLGGFNNLSPGMQENIVIVGALVAAIGPLVTAVGGFISIMAPALAAVSVLTAAIGTAGGVGLVGSLTLMLGPLALAAAAIVTLSVAIETAGEAAKKTRKQLNQIRGTIKDYKTVQGELEGDTKTLKKKTDELNEAIKTTGSNAQDAARLEIDAIRQRIAKNKELRRVYLDDMRLQLQRAKQTAERADTKSLAGLSPFLRDKTAEANDIRRKDGFAEGREAEYQKELDGLRSIIDAGDILSKKERKRFEKLNDYFKGRAERTHEILELERQIADIQADAIKPKKTAKVDPPKPVDPPKTTDTPKTKTKKKGDDPAKRSREAAEAIKRETAATIELANALAISQREYDIQKTSLDLVRDGYRGTEADVRAMATAMVDANAVMQKAQDAQRAKTEADREAALEVERLAEAERQKTEQSKLTVDAITQEVIENAKLAAAMQMSRYEYEVTAAQLDIMRQGFQGTSAEARKLAEDLVTSRGALDTARTGMTDAEDAAEKLKRELEDAGKAGVEAFQGIAGAFDQMARGLKSGSITDILGGILGMLDKIGGLTGGFKIAGLNFGGARKGGGNTYGGKTYLVGEEGPELFTSSTSGTIVPNHKLAQGGGQMGVKVIPSPYFDVVVDDRARAQAQPIAVATTMEGMGQAQRKSAYDNGRSLVRG